MHGPQTQFRNFVTARDLALDAGLHASLDRIASGAAAVLEVPLILISVIEGGRQAFVGSHRGGGLRPSQADDPSPLCREVVAAGRPIVMQDVRRRFPPGACHLCGFELVAYAGVPISFGAGTQVGAIAALAPTRRAWQARDLAVLRSFAEAAGAIFDMQLRCEELRTNLGAERRATVQQLATASAAYASLESRAADVAVETAERERVARNDHRRSTAELEITSIHDALTGLLNRRGLFAAGEAQLDIVRRRATPGVVLYIDVDGLKLTNDRCGHAAGDDLLRAAASVLRRSFREIDTLARLGGDEFVAIATDTPPSEHPAILARLAAELGRCNARRGSDVPLAWSVGVVTIEPNARVGLDALMYEADRRMYVAKRASHRGGAVEALRFASRT